MLRNLTDWILDLAWYMRPRDPVAVAAARLRHPAGKARHLSDDA